MYEKGSPLDDELPKINGVTLQLRHVYDKVQELGGSDKVGLI